MKRSAAALMALGLWLWAAGCGPAVRAADAAAGQPATGQARPRELKLTVKENRLFRVEKDVVTIKGLILAVQGEVRFTAGELVYDAKKKTALVTGCAQLTQDDLTLTADRFSASFDEERYVLDSGVKLVKKEKEPGKGDKLQLTAAHLEYDSRNRAMTATGGVQLKQKDRAATADRVSYRDKDGKVVLEGNVVVTEEDAQEKGKEKTIRGERISIDLDQDVVEVEGAVEVNFRL